MGNTLQIVDSISSSPTVLVDLNNDSPFSAFLIDAPPPPLRRSVSSSMLVDGDRISSSAYANRTINIGLDLIQTSQDNWATSWQALARQLDRETFWLKYQPTGATSPVFFRCYRAEVPAIDVIAGATAYARPNLSIPADPGARGLRVDFGATTVNNDPAAGSNGLFVDVTSVKGDLATEALVWTTNVTNPMVVAAEPSPPSGGIYFAQAEAAGTLGTDTTLPGADALMSGAGSSYTRTTFATDATLVARATDIVVNANIPVGDYRAWGRFRTSVGATPFQLQVGTAAPAGSDYYYGDVVSTTAIGTTARMVDLGVVRMGAGTAVGKTLALDVATVLNTPVISVKAARTSGTGNLDIDYILLVPADYAYAELEIGAASGRSSFVVDGPNDQLFSLTTTSPYTGSPKVSSPTPPPTTQPGFVGGLPLLYPNQTTRLYYLLKSTATKATTSSVSVSYWPQYLYVRPAST